jgi:hypothetical protein
MVESDFEVFEKANPSKQSSQGESGRKSRLNFEHTPQYMQRDCVRKYCGWHAVNAHHLVRLAFIDFQANALSDAGVK